MRSNFRRARAESDRASASLGYQSALQLASAQMSVIWTTFTAILYANIAILALIGAMVSLYKGNCVARFVAICICLGGIISCFIWVLVLRRMFSYHDYWFANARNFEKVALGTDKGMIQVGRRFSDGESIQLPDEDKPMVMPLFARMKVRTLADSIVILIGILYVGIIAVVYTIPEPLPARPAYAPVPTSPASNRLTQRPRHNPRVPRQH